VVVVVELGKDLAPLQESLAVQAVAQVEITLLDLVQVAQEQLDRVLLAEVLAHEQVKQTLQVLVAVALAVWGKLELTHMMQLALMVV
jgi:hypothetical protein